MFKLIEELFITPDDKLEKILATIQKSGIGIALVVDKNNKLLGTITDGDIRRAFLRKEKSLVAKNIMKTNPLISEEGLSKREMFLLLKENRRNQLPIVNKEGMVVDIVWVNKLLEELSEITIPLSEPDIGPLEIQYVNNTIQSTWISTAGTNVDIFRKKLSQYLGVKNVIMTNTGTAALHTLLLAFGIGKGDEVIVPALSFIATANAVVYTGAKPVFVDIDPDTWNINYRAIESSITDKTKAILVVHLLGNPANMNEISKIAKKYNLLLLEDAAQAFGSLYNKKLCGTIGDGAALSFNGNKLITTGGGGAIIIKENDKSSIANALVNQGRFSSEKYKHDLIGFNYRMTNLHAAVGLGQFERKDELLEKRKEIHNLYVSFLKNVRGIIFQKQYKGAKSNFWVTGVLVNEKQFGVSADELLKVLKSHGVLCEKLYPPITSQPPYKSFENNRNIVSYKISENTILLPSSSNLKKEDIKYISKVIEDVYDSYKKK